MKLDQSILKTIRYSDFFNFPLTFSELFSRLHTSAPVSSSRLHSAVSRLVASGTLAQTREYYHLPGRSNLVPRRKRMLASSRPKLKLAQVYARHLSRVPGVLAIYLTGSLAVQNADEGDDIDFLIITHPGLLWLTRLFVTAVAELYGIRRRPAETASRDHLCLNMYLTATSLKLPAAKRSLYSAYELIQALPLYDPHNTQTHLLTQNSWLKRYLANFVLPLASSYFAHPPILPLRLLESLVFTAQRHYMQKKITAEYITRDQAFFHPRTLAKAIMSAI